MIEVTTGHERGGPCLICREAASYDQGLVVDGAMFVAGAERGRGLVFVGGGALVVVGGTGYANNRGWQPMGGGCDTP